MNERHDVAPHSFAARLPLINSVMIAGVIASEASVADNGRTVFSVRIANGTSSQEPLLIECTCAGSVAHRLVTARCVGVPVIVSGSLSRGARSGRLHIRVAALQFLD